MKSVSASSERPAPPTMWGHNKKASLMYQKVGPHQVTMLVSWAILFVVCDLPSSWYCKYLRALKDFFLDTYDQSIKILKWRMGGVRETIFRCLFRNHLGLIQQWQLSMPLSQGPSGILTPSFLATYNKGDSTPWGIKGGGALRKRVLERT